MTKYTFGDLSDYLSKKRKKDTKNSELDSLFASKEENVSNKQENIVEKKEKKTKKKIDQSTLLKVSNNKSEPLTRKEFNIKNASKRLQKKLISGDIKIKNERTIFVGNISNKIKKKELLKLFEPCGKIESLRLRSVPVASLKLPKKALVIRNDLNPHRHNMNAYVVFENQETCEMALKMNGIEFQGFHLRVDRVKNSKKNDAKNSIFIGNLPFDIEEEDLRKLFGDCGEIENVRVVRDKITSVGKGIAFVSFKNSESMDLALTMEGVECKKRNIRIMKASKSQKKFKKDFKSSEEHKNKSTSSTKSFKENRFKTKFNVNKHKYDKASISDKNENKKKVSKEGGKQFVGEKIKNSKNLNKKKKTSKQNINSLKLAKYFSDKLKK